VIDAMATPPIRTLTATVDEDLVPDDAELITWLGEYGTDVEHAFPAAKGRITVGSRDCDLVIASPYVSTFHAVLERKGRVIRVHDQSSRNGIFFGEEKKRDSGRDVALGEMFRIARTRLLAMNDVMRAARPRIADLVGYDDRKAVDHLLVKAVGTERILITGPDGAGHERLATLIDQASRHRSVAPVTVNANDDKGRTPLAPPDDAIDRARGGTLILTVDGRVIDPAWAARALDPDAQARLIIIAPTLKLAANSVGLAVIAKVEEVKLRALRERADDVPTLLDRLLEAEGAPARFASFTPPNQRALKKYGWKGNFDEAAEAAYYLAALVTHESIRSAAPALDLPRSTLQYWTKRMKLALPLLS